MANKIIVQTKHKFTEAGRWGIGLFMLSPVMGGIAYAVILHEAADRYSSGPGAAPLFLGLASIGFCAAIPLMLIGRASLHLAETIEGSDKADEIWADWSKMDSETMSKKHQ